LYIKIELKFTLPYNAKVTVYYNYSINYEYQEPDCTAFCPMDQYLHKDPVVAFKAYSTSATLVQPQVTKLVCF